MVKYKSWAEQVGLVHDWSVLIKTTFVKSLGRSIVVHPDRVPMKTSTDSSRWQTEQCSDNCLHWFPKTLWSSLKSNICNSPVTVTSISPLSVPWPNYHPADNDMHGCLSHHPWKGLQNFGKTFGAVTRPKWRDLNLSPTKFQKTSSVPGESALRDKHRSFP